MTTPRHRTSAKRSSRGRAGASQSGVDRRWILGGAAAVIVIAALAAIVLTRPATTGVGSTSSTQPPASGAASVGATGAALPAFTSTAGDPAIGSSIPEARGVSFDGSPVAIRQDGRPKLLLFLAHWCPHCQREVPVVKAWLDSGRLPAGVDLISVATATDPARPNYPPSDWLAREGWQPPVLVDRDNAVADRFGLSAFPYWVAVDADGKVAMRLTGELTPAQLDALAASVAS